MRLKLIATIIAAGAVLTMWNGRSQTLVQKAEQDQTILVRSDDRDMAAARRKARDGLPEFLSLARAPSGTMSKFAVKVAIHDESWVEYFWIAPFEQTGAGLSGRINNSPTTVTNVKLGDKITFAEQEIVDWLYLDGGRMKGNYTACAMFKHAPRQEAEAAIQRFGMSCDP